MRLLRIPEPFDHADWVFEPKMDGFRALAHIRGHHCTLVSRNGHIFKPWPQLAEEIAHSARPSSSSRTGQRGNSGHDQPVIQRRSECLQRPGKRAEIGPGFRPGLSYHTPRRAKLSEPGDRGLSWRLERGVHFNGSQSAAVSGSHLLSARLHTSTAVMGWISHSVRRLGGVLAGSSLLLTMWMES
jgi:hypothetical protein